MTKIPMSMSRVRSASRHNSEDSILIRESDTHMSGIIICKTKTADNPYTFLNTKITIYSYEELCYYIFNNMVLIGKDDLADRLSTWLRTAIDMEDLADKIDALNAKNAYIQDIMVEILTFGEFYSKDEVKEFMDEC